MHRLSSVRGRWFCMIGLAFASTAPVALAQSFNVTSGIFIGTGSLSNGIATANAWTGSGPFVINFPNPISITLQGETGTLRDTHTTVF